MTSIQSKIDTIRNIAVAGVVIASVALLFNASGTLNAQTPPPVVNNGDVISLIGTHDVYVAIIDGTTRYKRHLTSPEVFEAYEHRTWADVFAVPSTVFDSFETRDAISSVSAARALATTLRVTTTSVDTGVPGQEPTTPTIQDGDAIQAHGSNDVHLVKIVNNKKFKRLILNPDVFNSYGHLSWENVKSVHPTVLNQHTTSNLVRYGGNVYALFPEGDTGTRRFVNAGSVYDQDSVYEINNTELGLYSVGFPITLPETTSTDTDTQEVTIQSVPETPPTTRTTTRTTGSSGGGGGISFLSNPTRLPTPENLTAEIPDHATINDPIVIKDPSNAQVSWQKVKGATGYEVQWCTNSCPQDSDKWSGRATVKGENTISYRITATENWADGIFTDRADAQIRVRALKGTSSGRRSKWATTRIANLATLDPITNLRMLQADGSGRIRFRVGWDALTGDTTNIEYDLVYYKAGTDWYTGMYQDPTTERNEAGDEQQEDLTKKAWNGLYERTGTTKCVNDGWNGANSNHIADNNWKAHWRTDVLERQKAIIIVCHATPEAFLNAFGNWNTTYLVWIRQKANDNSAYSPFSKPIKVATSAFNISHTNELDSITLEWNKTIDHDNGNQVLNKNPDDTRVYVDTYKVQYCEASGSCPANSDTGWTTVSQSNIRTKSGDNTKATTTITGLTRSTNYKIRIKPTFDNSNNEIASIHTYWTNKTVRTKDSITLGALANFRVKKMDESGRNDVLLEWNAPSETSPTYEFRYRQGSTGNWVADQSKVLTLAGKTSNDNQGRTGTSPNFVYDYSCKPYWRVRKDGSWNGGSGSHTPAKNAFICPDGNELLFVDLGVWNTLYEYEIRHKTGTIANNDLEYSEWQRLRITTGANISTTATTNSITLEWAKLQRGLVPDSWEVQRCTGACALDSNDWVTVTSSSSQPTDKTGDATKKTYTITGLSGSTTYKVRVKPLFTTGDNANIQGQYYLKKEQATS